MHEGVADGRKACRSGELVSGRGRNHDEHGEDAVGRQFAAIENLAGTHLIDERRDASSHQFAFREFNSMLGREATRVLRNRPVERPERPPGYEREVVWKTTSVQAGSTESRQAGEAVSPRADALRLI